ncbi:MAG TPA: hypothetical protein VK638_23660 [Edaphobacter sp.]|nr:hypothetical protein [Edaphobacter sp.]
MQIRSGQTGSRPIFPLLVISNAFARRYGEANAEYDPLTTRAFLGIDLKIEWRA